MKGKHTEPVAVDVLRLGPPLFRFFFFCAGCCPPCSSCSKFFSTAAIFLFSRSERGTPGADPESPGFRREGVISRLRGLLRNDPEFDLLSSISSSKFRNTSLLALLLFTKPVVGGEGLLVYPFRPFATLPLDNSFEPWLLDLPLRRSYRASVH